MRERKLAISSAVVASLALAAVPRSARAVVIVKTFGFSICVTGKKHPDGCKSAGSYHFRQNGLLISSQRSADETPISRSSVCDIRANSALSCCRRRQVRSLPVSRVITDSVDCAIKSTVLLASAEEGSGRESCALLLPPARLLKLAMGPSANDQTPYETSEAMELPLISVRE